MNRELINKASNQLLTVGNNIRLLHETYNELYPKGCFVWYHTPKNKMQKYPIHGYIGTLLIGVAQDGNNILLEFNRIIHDRSPIQKRKRIFM